MPVAHSVLSASHQNNPVCWVTRGLITNRVATMNVLETTFIMCVRGAEFRVLFDMNSSIRWNMYIHTYVFNYERLPQFSVFLVLISVSLTCC